MTLPRMLILSMAPVHNGPRVLRQVRRFRAEYDVTTVAYGAAPSDGVTHIELPEGGRSGIGGRLRRLVFAGLLLVRLQSLAWRIHPVVRDMRAAVRGSTWDVVIAHDVMVTPIAFDVRARVRVVDLHEFAPSQGEDRWWWRVTLGPLFTMLCRRWVPRADATITVAHGIAAEYRRRFGLDPAVITNATDYAELPPHPTSAPIRLVHSGVAAPARKLDTMIEAVRDGDLDVTLDLYLVGDGSGHLDELRALASGDDRISVRDALPYAELVPRLNEYDVGLTLIAPSTFNLRWCLPNKLFDFVQARLAILTGPSPEMAAVVAGRGLGVVADGFDAAAVRRAIAGLDAAGVDAAKRASDAAAHDLSGQVEMDRLAVIVAELLAERTA